MGFYNRTFGANILPKASETRRPHNSKRSDLRASLRACSLPEAKRAERRYAPTPCLFHQLKHFFVLSAHAVAGAQDFFFVEGIGFEFVDKFVAAFNDFVQRIYLLLIELDFF